MAGTLTIDTLKASSGVLATQNGMTGIAKAWLNYNGSTGTILSSFNVGSVTKNGTGDYTVNFTTSMPDANYSAGSVTWNNGSARFPIEFNSKLAASFRFITTSGYAGSTADSTNICLSFFSA